MYDIYIYIFKPCGVIISTSLNYYCTIFVAKNQLNSHIYLHININGNQNNWMYINYITGVVYGIIQIKFISRKLFKYFYCDRFDKHQCTG